MTELILASGSAYKAQLLNKIVDKFQSVTPDFEERCDPEKPPEENALKLALGKAESVAKSLKQPPGQEFLVLGADQICYIPGHTNARHTYLHKPGGIDQAISALMRCSGETVKYVTAATIVDGTSQLRSRIVDEYELDFRKLSAGEIRAYCELEKPWDCAGSIKSESFGINLIQRYRGDDPNTLIGLPLIKLRAELVQLGLNVLCSSSEPA